MAPGLLARLGGGAAAGAAATAALDATTYLDMALRGRPASTTPEATVERVAGAVGIEVAGDPEVRAHRLEGLGALAGIATGVFAGVGYGLLDAAGLRPRGPLGRALLAGGGAMLLANGAMVAFGVTDPRRWSAADWWSDVVPHAVYGLVLEAAYDAAAS
jgi:hypothetical protein